MLLIWRKAAPDVPTVKKEKCVKDGKRSASGVFSPLILAIMAAIALQGMLRDGVTTWMPSYISETYDLGNGISIFSSTNNNINLLTIASATKSIILSSSQFNN